MKVKVLIEEIEIEGESGYPVESIEATCSRCKHSVEVFGRSDASIRRACLMLREECPRGENNFYADSGGQKWNR